MQKINDGGPAFPQFEVVAGERDGHGDVIDAYTTAQGGMSLRDWFAGQALIGLLHPGYAADTMRAPEHAYRLADAMIEARKVKP